MATLSPQDRDYLIRTVIGEAANQPRRGKAAVAHTIMNRRNTGRWGDSVQDVVLAKNQFEPWGTRADELYNISPDSDVYQQTGQLVDQVAAGQIPDPTQGGLFFLNPDIR
jgi:spore germination cell wall hydrolase CwlJ-like protein